MRSLSHTSPAEIEAALLNVLLDAESVRRGAESLLRALEPVIDEQTTAIALRDRDGLTLHVLAEHGGPFDWPSRIDPQVAGRARPGVEAASGALVVPLRAQGRGIGAFLFADPSLAQAFVQDPQLMALVDTVAAVLQALIARTDAELRRRALVLRSIDAVVDGMAHQIANPLTGASATAQLLEEGLRDEGQKESVRQIRHELTRAFTVLHDILEFHRDTNAQDGVLDLSSVVERILRFRSYAIREQGIAIHTEASPEFLPVRLDARALEHAILLALRFAELRSGGTVNRSIRVRATDYGAAEVAIQITDSGPGTIPELTTSSFDLSLSDPERSATGVADEPPDLGLVASILRGCGGRLDVTASKTDGTTLSLVVPRASLATTGDGA